MHRLLIFFLITILTGCQVKSNSDSPISMPPDTPVVLTPTNVFLIDPLTTTSNDTTPTFRIDGVSAGLSVSLYSNSTCTVLQASGIASSTSIDLTTSALTDGIYNFYAAATDVNGNVSACSSASTAYTLLTQPPVISGVSNDLIPKKVKNWNWSCSTSCTYRFVIDQNPVTLPTGAYSAVVGANQLSGDSTFYLHLQALDFAGNESLVGHFSAILDNTAPTAPSSIVLKAPLTSPSNITTPVLTVNGVNNSETVSLFSDSTCLNSLGTSLSVGTTVDVTTSALAAGSYTFYASTTDIAGNISSCSIGFASYVLDTSQPIVVNILPPTAGAYSIGSTLDFQLTFDETVSVSGVPCLELVIGTLVRPVCYFSGSPSNALSFSYTVQTGDDDSDGVVFAGFNILLNGGSITDGVGNSSQLNFLAVAPNLSAVTINTSIAAPNIVSSVTQTNLSSDRKNVSFIWSAPNGNGNPVTKYIIRYKKENTSQFTFLSPEPTSASATITNLDINSIYDIQVAAFNGVIGPYSAILKVSTFFNPKSLGALIWYEAKDVNGTGIPASDGTSISTLTDKSGNNNHAAKISGTSATIQTVGGFKVIRMDVAGYRTAVSLGETANTSVEVYIVAKTRQVTASFAFVNENQANANRYGSHFPWSDNNAYVDLPIANRISGNWGGNITDFFAWTFRSSTTAGIALERNGIPLLSGPNRANTPPLKRWTIGSNYTGAGEFWKADVQAFFVFSKVLDAAQRAEFFQFIQDEYGVLMP